MKVVAAETLPNDAPSDVETFVVSRAQFDFLGRLARQINPDMPMEFAGAHIIRTLLERFEESGIDLTAAKSEEELVEIATRSLKR
jgi:hypothetical protein